MTALVAVLIKLTTSATTDRDVASNFEPLEFDIESLRIRDLAEDQDYQEFKKRAPSIYESIKAKSSLHT